MKTGLIASGVVILIIAFFYLTMRPEYDFKNYVFENCSNTNLTTIVYWEPGERGVIFAKGSNKEKPDKEYVKMNQLSGFDAGFECVATCKSGVITLNYYSGYFVPDLTSENIKLKRVNTDTYIRLRDNSNGKLIKIY